METGPAKEIEVEETSEAVEPTENETTKRSLVINLDDDGKMDLDFQGDFKTHEAFGILAVSFIDLAVQQFINPGLISVVQAGKTSEANILGVVKASLEAVANSNVQTATAAPQTNELLTGLQDVIDQFSNK